MSFPVNDHPLSARRNAEVSVVKKNYRVGNSDSQLALSMHSPQRSLLSNPSCCELCAQEATAPPPPPPVPDPPASLCMDGGGDDCRFFINIRCRDFDDKAHTWSQAKQEDYMSKCMGQDCEQSLGTGTSGCRYTDANGFCYSKEDSQLWCSENPSSPHCHDGGSSWATPPIGTFSVTSSQPNPTWTPRQRFDWLT